MTSQYLQVVADLAEEHAALDEVLARLSPDQWDTPTHAPGWAVRHQVAHLAVFDEVARLAIVDVPAFRARRIAEPEYLSQADAQTPDDLFATWRRASSELVSAARELDPSARLPWYGPDMSATSFVTARLMECWSHGLDVVDVVGIDRPDTDRLRHVAFIGFRTRAFSYVNRGLEPPEAPVFVELTAPSGAVWTFGEPSAADRISGPATDFCRVVTQRRHVSDTALRLDGPAAREWMDIAQAFAGPAGSGRSPGQFS